MKAKYFFLALCCLVMTGCGLPATTFKVLDEQTGKPIEGAVAIAYTIKYHGLPGLQYAHDNEIVEGITDAEGMVTIPPLSQIPRMKVYKPGYVGWDSRYVYLGCYKGASYWDFRYERRDGFEYKGQTFYLKPWKNKPMDVSHYSHWKFIYMNLPTKSKIHFKNIVDQYEIPLSDMEEESYRQKGSFK
jgi:hypothetical protein